MIFILALLFSLQVKKGKSPCDRFPAPVFCVPVLRRVVPAPALCCPLRCVVLCVVILINDIYYLLCSYSLPCVVLCVILFLLFLYLVQYAVGSHLLPQLFGSHACVNARRV